MSFFLCRVREKPKLSTRRHRDTQVNQRRFQSGNYVVLVMFCRAGGTRAVSYLKGGAYFFYALNHQHLHCKCGRRGLHPPYDEEAQLYKLIKLCWASLCSAPTYDIQRSTLIFFYENRKTISLQKFNYRDVALGAKHSNTLVLREWSISCLGIVR